ncbi:tetratricopeptide repeat protein [Haloferula chungangensis]|uniref:Tetratricopeptide repeat protein n=1 Tax=Haloferula chungangensis TaxID=1048331 RepID=A0ABW2L9V6_9BACT
MRLLALLFLIPGLSMAQEAPRAVPVDPNLQRDVGQDWFQHGRNVYESAKRTNGPTQFELYVRAAEIFSRYITEYPRHQNAEAAWWYLGQSYRAIGRPEDAKRCFHSLLNRFGKGRYAAAAAYSLAADHYNNRQYALAATLFEKLAAIATKSSDRQRGQFYAAQSYEMMRQDRQAIAYYRKLLDDPDPNNGYRSKAEVALGTLYAKSGKLEEALQLLGKVAVSHSTPEIRGKAALEAGAVAARLGDTELSDKYFNLILRTPGMEDYRPDAQIALMAARFDQKRYRDVVTIFSQSTTPSTGEREARRLMLGARSYMMLDRNADAMPLFRAIERLELPDSNYAFDASYFRLLCFYRIEGRHVLDQVDGFLQIYRKKHPRDAKIHTALLMKAETLFAEDKPAEAADVYRDIDSTLLSEKNRRGMLYQRGRCLAEAKDPEGAIKSLTDFINKYPTDERVPLARATRATAYATTGQSGLAIADFQQIIETTKDDTLLTLAYLESADISKQANDLDGMINYYLAFLKEVPDPDEDAVAKASYWAGWAMVKKNRGDEALPYLERARELSPKYYDKHAGLLLCLVHLSMKKPSELIAELEVAITKGYALNLPEQLIRWAADQAFNRKEFLNAARFYDLIADDENPELAPKEIWRFLGKARNESNDPTGALAAIEHALDQESDAAWQADCLNDKGRALYKLKRYDEAMKAVEEGLALRPEGRIGASLHMLRGEIYEAQGNLKEAIRSFVLPVQLMADSDQVVKPRALKMLIAALQKDGQSDAALRYQQELDRKYPGWEE